MEKYLGRGFHGFRKGRKFDAAQIPSLRPGVILLWESVTHEGLPNARNALEVISLDPMGLDRPLFYAKYHDSNTAPMCFWDFEVRGEGEQFYFGHK